MSLKLLRGYGYRASYRNSHSSLRCCAGRDVPSVSIGAMALCSSPPRRHLSGRNGHPEGTWSRTDRNIEITHPGPEVQDRGSPASGQSHRHTKPTLQSFSLDGDVVVITGGAQGLGLVMAQAAVASGANVALVDLNKDVASRAAETLVKHYHEENPEAAWTPKVTAHHSDVADPDSVRASIDEVLGVHGKIDKLVTSAGFTENYDAIEYPVEQMRKLWRVNVDGTYFFATAVARHLMSRKARGSMVLIGSMSASVVNVPQPQAPYNASKAAIKHLASSLAVEWAHAGIRVNCLSPGYMLTALTQKILDENPALRDKWTALIPEGRIGRPEELMGAVIYLLSDAAAYTTGTELVVDGGYTVT